MIKRYVTGCFLIFPSMLSLLQVSRYSQVFLQFLKSAYGIICVFSSLWIGTYAALKNDEEKEVAWWGAQCWDRSAQRSRGAGQELKIRARMPVRVVLRVFSMMCLMCSLTVCSVTLSAFAISLFVCPLAR